MSKYITDTQISKMSYNEMGRKLTTGELTEKRLKDYYTSARKKALDRYRRTSKTEEFGDIEKQTFAKLKNLLTTSALVHEIADVNRYLSSASSTITGLRKRREQVLSTLSYHGFDFVDESNYGEWLRFLNWFKGSDYARLYDSTDEAIEDAFMQAESATPADWERALNKFMEKTT